MNILTTANFNPIGQDNPPDKMLVTYALSHKHLIEKVERFKWVNLPPELTADLIERILYFRGKGCIFKGVDDKFRFLPFTLSGKIDLYGRYINLIPQLFNGQNNHKDYYNSGKPLKVSYAIDEEGEAVILTDSTLEVSQDLLPESITIKPIIEQMTEIIVLVNIDLINSAKVYTIIAEDEAQKRAIELEFEGMDERILNGKRVIVVTSKTGILNELTGDKNSKDSNRYFQVYQSFDNLRKDLIGISNSGTFMKNSIQTDSEVAQNQNSGSAVLNNALRQRQEFSAIANKVFGLNISVEINENQVAEVVGLSSNNNDRNEGTIEEDE